MSKFKTNLTLSNKDLKGKRAGVAEEDAKIGAEDEIRQLTDKQRSIKRRLMEIEDFGPDNTTSLRPIHKDFNGRAWFKELSDLKLELELVSAHIKICNSAYDEYFSEDLVETA